jgi:hypothetical protein
MGTRDGTLAVTELGPPSWSSPGLGSAGAGGRAGQDPARCTTEYQCHLAGHCPATPRELKDHGGQKYSKVTVLRDGEGGD